MNKTKLYPFLSKVHINHKHNPSQYSLVRRFSVSDGEGGEILPLRMAEEPGTNFTLKI